jgi:hypothetical protein
MNLPELVTISANQAYIKYRDAVTLFSYDTPVVTLYKDKTILHPDWKFSPTTSMHRAKFLNENTATTTKKLKQGIYDLIPYSALEID